MTGRAALTRPEDFAMKRHAAAFAAAALLAAAPAMADPPREEGAFNFRAGGFFPRGDSDFWKTNEQAFTLDHSDFNGFITGVGYTEAINNWFELDFNADFYYSTNTSADRNFTDQNGFPILHDSRLTLVPLTFGFKVLPAGRYARRGHEGQHLVRRPVPYIGGGIGGDYWKYEEEGDFVATNLSIVYDRFVDSGIEFEKHLYAGIEFPVGPRWYITFEVRQSWAEAHPSGAFTGINTGALDLGGTSVMLGGSLRF
jgi:hypothetical protein